MARVPLLALIPPAAFAALAGLFAAGMWRGDGQELPSVLIGRPAPGLPDSTLPDLPQLDPAVLADGKVKLVNFFASWCAPCRVEHPNLRALATGGLPIYGIAYKDDPARATAFLDELGDPYAAVGADPDGRMAVDWGVYGVPETFVVDGDGTIIARMANPLTERIIKDRLEPALEEAAKQGQ